MAAAPAANRPRDDLTKAAQGGSRSSATAATLEPPTSAPAPSISMATKGWSANASRSMDSSP
jgi:hypothetical protein